MSEVQQDLIVLVPGVDEEVTIKGILARQKSLGIRDVRYTVARHPQRDAGCYTKGAEFLREEYRSYKHALVIFDHDGSGAEKMPAPEIELEIEAALTRTGWDNRAACIVMEPELEAWVWSDSPEVDTALGWVRGKSNLRKWLVEQNLLSKGDVKPNDPKNAMRQALKFANKTVSASIFGQLAKNVSFKRCTDRSFCKLQSVLRRWFSVEKSATEATESTEEEG